MSSYHRQRKDFLFSDLSLEKGYGEWPLNDDLTIFTSDFVRDKFGDHCGAKVFLEKDFWYKSIIYLS